MIRSGVLALAPLFWAILAADPQPAKFPTFQEYPAGEAFSGKPAAPILKTANQRMFRTMIRQGAAKGPNFAGRFTVAEWGCGGGCASIAVIDARDGTVYDGPFQSLSWSLFKYEGQYAANANDFAQLEYRKDSRLLIARGCPEDENCASYFYEWAPPKFKLLRKVPATPLEP